MELDGDDHIPWVGDADAVLDSVQTFLTGSAETEPAERQLATLLFTDLVDSTATAARIGDRAWRDVLERHHADVRRQLGRYRGREVDAAGDGFLAVFDGPARAVQAAIAIRDDAARSGLGVRAGVHTGEVEVLGSKFAGIAVHIAARIMARAAGGEVLVSRTVRDLVSGAKLALEDRGTHALKGVDEPWQLYAVV